MEWELHEQAGVACHCKLNGTLCEMFDDLCVIVVNKEFYICCLVVTIVEDLNRKQGKESSLLFWENAKWPPTYSRLCSR